MSLAALVLVVIAAAFHVAWNVLTKGSRDRVVFLWWTGVAGVVIFLPLVWWSTPSVLSVPDGLRLGLGALIRAAYFAALGAAYARGDLSLVYPLARGTAPVLVPIAAAIFLGERLSFVGGLGVGAVAIGVYVLHLPGFRRRDLLGPIRAFRAGHARFAILTGLLTTAYSIVDKWNIDAGLAPILYAYATIPVAALILTPVALRRRPAVRAVRRAAGWRIPAVSVLMTSGYLLVLFALRFTPVSYVAPARELGIVLGAFAGAVGLKEGYGLQRVAGASVIVVGVLLIAAA